MPAPVAEPEPEELERSFDEWLALLMPEGNDRRVTAGLRAFFDQSPGPADLAHLRLVASVTPGLPPEVVSKVIAAVPVLGPESPDVYELDFDFLSERMNAVFDAALESGSTVPPAKRASLVVDLVQASANAMAADMPVDEWPATYVAHRRARLTQRAEAGSARTLIDVAADPLATDAHIRRLVERVSEFDMATTAGFDLARAIARSDRNDADTLRTLFAVAPRAYREILGHDAVPSDVVEAAFAAGYEAEAVASRGATTELLRAAMDKSSLLRAVCDSKAADETILLEALSRIDLEADPVDGRLALMDAACNANATDEVQFRALALSDGFSGELAAKTASRAVLESLARTHSDRWTLERVIGNPLVTNEIIDLAVANAENPERLAGDVQWAKNRLLDGGRSDRWTPDRVTLPAAQMIVDTASHVRLGLRVKAAAVRGWADLPSKLDRPLPNKDFAALEGAWTPSGVQFRLVPTARQVKHLGKVLDNCMIERFDSSTIDAFATLHDADGAVVGVVNWRLKGGNSWTPKWIQGRTSSALDPAITQDVKQATDWALGRGDFAASRQAGLSPGL